MTVTIKLTHKEISELENTYGLSCDDLSEDEMSDREQAKVVRSLKDKLSSALCRSRAKQ